MLKNICIFKQVHENLNQVNKLNIVDYREIDLKELKEFKMEIRRTRNVPSNDSVEHIISVGMKAVTKDAFDDLKNLQELKIKFCRNAQSNYIDKDTLVNLKKLELLEVFVNLIVDANQSVPIFLNLENGDSL